jgi:transposase-like protein
VSIKGVPAKTKTMLPNDQAVETVVYLALMQISKKWANVLQRLFFDVVHFIDIFGERCEVKI